MLSDWYGTSRYIYVTYKTSLITCLVKMKKNVFPTTGKGKIWPEVYNLSFYTLNSLFSCDLKLF